MARGRRRGVALESIDRGGAGRGEMLGLVSVREKQGERRGINSAARPREREMEDGRGFLLWHKTSVLRYVCFSLWRFDLFRFALLFSLTPANWFAYYEISGGDKGSSAANDVDACGFELLEPSSLLSSYPTHFGVRQAQQGQQRLSPQSKKGR
ncbi:hypothetical protein DAI22_03g165550 [Oryza sativa Japonica Group]|nr:hypothetical protein DAI22_03g165550 [Oryza sativa Japonica Group]